MNPPYLRRMCLPDAVGRSGWPVDGADPGVTVLIPTYSPAGGDRVGKLRRCLDSVLADARVPVSLVVVDNGLTRAHAGAVGDLLAATGRPHTVVDARATGARLVGGRLRYTAADARNAGLDALAALPVESPVRRRYLMFLDDDTAPAPGALAVLVSTMDHQPDAIAVCPQVVPVDDPGQWLRDQPRTPAGGPARRLPGPVHDGRYDLLSVTAYGSLVTGRTVGLLVRQAPVLDLIRRQGPLFFTDTPFGSSEDMLAMAMLARLGRLWSVPAARVADEARATPGTTRTQQFAWGYDHAWLARALHLAGALEPGVQVLDWTPTGWWQHHLPWAGHTGVLVNPAEVGFAYRLLRAVATHGGAFFGGHADQVLRGLPLLGRVLRRWHAMSGPGPVRDGSVRHRPDLPPLGPRDVDGLRDGLDALLGHLAGNVAGSTTGVDGTWFLYGARQPAAAPTSISLNRPAPGLDRARLIGA
jgi:hypothetical protein